MISEELKRDKGFSRVWEFNCESQNVISEFDVGYGQGLTGDVGRQHCCLDDQNRSNSNLESLQISSEFLIARL
jgi:hypothetical protein